MLSRRIEKAYPAACAQPLADIALLVLEAGLRIGEVLSLLWADLELEALLARASAISESGTARARTRAEPFR